MRQLVREPVDGIVVLAPQVRVFNVLRGHGRRHAVREPADRVGSDGVSHSADQVAGARMTTEHLIDLGHSDILHLAGPQDWIEAESRMRGYLDAMRDADLPHASRRSAATGPPTSATSRGRSSPLRRDFTAVFAANDLMAIGLMHGFRDAGLRVPDDVSVVGFDDVPVAAHVAPPLTTVHQDFPELGRRAVQILLAQIRGEDAAGVRAGAFRCSARRESAASR